MALLASMNARLSDVLAISVGVALLIFSVWRFASRTRATKLSGPPRPSWIFGFNKSINDGVSGDLFEGWQKQYGDVFQIPTAMGGHRTVLMDPRAVAYVFNGNSYNYRRHEGQRLLFKRGLGGGILWAEGDAHKRHRRAMSPGFTPAAIRSFTAFFLDAAHKVADAWNLATTESATGDVLVNVETWLNCISLDSIGLAGFSHNFNCVDGERPTVYGIFTSFGKTGDVFSMLVLLLSQAIPALIHVPLGRNKQFSDLKDASADIAKKLLNERKVDSKDEAAERRSVISALIKAENRTLSEDEVLAELNTLILAGFETTSTSMAWCLHELSIHPDIQQRLRSELENFPEPTPEQLANNMPYLEAVVNETLRTHPVVLENHRVVISNDSIPVLHPVIAADGKVVDRIQVKAGTGVVVPIEAVNRSTLVWGPDAHIFNPDRWLAGDLPAAAQDMQGYHHLLTFIDGPRHCIGKHFAVAEFKAVLAVLVRSFVFKPKTDGNDIRRVRTITLRARNEGTDGLYLHVAKVESE